MENLSVILPAAGRSTRFGGGEVKKVFTPLVGKPVWLRSVEVFASLDFVDKIVVVVSPDDFEFFCKEFQSEIEQHSLKVVRGGEERYQSVQNGMDALFGEQQPLESAEKGDHSSVQWVAIHDAARPLILPHQVEEVFSAAKKSGAAILASPITATIKYVEADQVSRTVDRNGLFSAQTPQIFQVEKLRQSYRQLLESSQDSIPTDECLLMETLGVAVAVVSGDDQNIKITHKSDMAIAEAILAARMNSSAGGQF